MPEHAGESEVELEEALQRLRSCESRCRKIVTASSYGILFVDPDHRILFANSAAGALFGSPVEELVGERWEGSMDSQGPGEFTLQRRDGRSVRVESWATESEWGGNPAWFITLHDLSARKRQEEVTGLLAAIVDSSEDAIIGITLDGIISSWNRGAEKIYGYRSEEAMGRSVTFLTPPDSRHEGLAILERIRGGERVEHLETVQLTKEGKTRYVSLTVSPILAESGEITGISTIARDITERKEMEEELRRSERRYRTLVELAPDGVIVQRDGRILYANCAALGIYGATALKQLQERALLDLVHSDDRESLRDRMERVQLGEEVPLREYRLLRLDGREVPVETSCTLIDYQGKPALQVIARDVSARKKVELEREMLVAELEKATARFETALRHMPVGVAIAEAPPGRLVYNSERVLRIFREHAIGPEDDHSSHIRRLDGSDLPPQEYPLARALKGEAVNGEEFLVLRGDGTRGFVSINAAPISDGSGNIFSSVATFTDITERVIAAQALRKSEERLKLALDAAEMGSCDIAIPSGKGVWSRLHFQLLGYEPPSGDVGPADIEMWQTLIHGEDREGVAAALGVAQREHSLFQSEHRILRADDGRMLWVNVLGRFLYDRSGAAYRFIGVIFDVTERKISEETLRRSEQRYRLLFETIPQGIIYQDAEGRIISANPAAENIVGIGGAQLLGRTLADLVRMTHEDGSVVAAADNPGMTALRTGREVHDVVVGMFNPKEQEYRWVSISAVPQFRPKEATPYQVYNMFQDITGRRRAEEALRASEAKFRWLFESNLIPMYFWKADGRIVEANRAYCDLVGCSYDQCGGKLSWREVVAPEYLDQVEAAMEETEVRGVCKPYEKAFVHLRDKHRIPVLNAAARTIGGEADGIGIAIDLTELKRTEEALRNSETTLKLALEATGLGTFEFNPQSGKLIWSESAKRHYGLPPAADNVTTYDFFSSLVHPQDRERVERLVQRALDPQSGGKFSAQYRAVGPVDGQERIIAARGQTYFDEKGAPVRMAGTCLDLTDILRVEQSLKEEMSQRLQAVEELRQKEKLLVQQGRFAAMGEMINNIAHQWRQPLNTLGLIVQELQRFYDSDLFTREYLQESVGKAMNLISHMSRTIDGFRNFFRPDKEETTFRAGEVVDKTVAIVQTTFNVSGLGIEVNEEDDIFIHGSTNEYSQVILNILMNARDIFLERKVANPKVVLRLFKENGKAVLTIADNGGGIPADIIDKIFDPYFTTKSPDKGTGIGLFMSKTIVEKNMNGSLTVRNTSEGAEFRIEV